VRKRRRYRSKPRTYWDGSYKPFYEFTFLDDYLETEMTEEEFVDRWWGFLDYMDAIHMEWFPGKK
jgi:hypothetical protein